MKLPILYKQTSTGAIQQWGISTNANAIITEYGQVDGKKQIAEDIIKVGKNIGKSNATGPIEQAEIEAQAQWEGKIKKGYVENMARAIKNETDVAGGWLPMLAHKFSEQGHKIKYPAYCQPKLDGFRNVSDENFDFWSRTRKPVHSIDHIGNALKEHFKGCPWFPRLDGELYNHDYHNKFEELSHFIKQPKTIAGSEIIQYHIYDMWHPDETMTFEQRYNWLKGSIPAKHPYLKLVETIKVKDEDELMLAFEHYKELGYEGAIVRNADSLYEHKRSYSLLKIKEFDDSEFNIIGVTEGRGKLQGSAIFVCKTEEGNTFEVKLKGPLSELKKFWDDKSTWIGKKLMVQYQGFTTKNKVPRFPVGVRIREEE
jgi:DNA ligase-1